MIAPTLFLQRLSTRIARKLGRDPADQAVAAEVVEVSPDEQAQRPAAFALPGQLERVRATAPDTTLENEMARITGGTVRHDATRAYRFRDLQYFDGFLYCGGMRRQQVVRPEPLLGHGPVEEIDCCSLPGTTVGDQFFGHFLIDDSATALLAERFAPPRLPRPTARQGWSHALRYRERLDIAIPPWPRDPQGIYFGGNDMLLSPRALLRIGEMLRLDGQWQGRRVLPAEWIADSWTPRTRSPWSGQLYGYGWWIGAARGVPVFFAWGYGGQMLYVVPELAASVVMLSDPAAPRDPAHMAGLHGLLTDAILPALGATGDGGLLVPEAG